MAERYDVIILGGGNAGFGVSAVVHEAGRSIAFVEERDFGGTCPNRGCTPKKVLVAAGHALHEIELAAAHGIDVGKPKLDWAKLIDRERGMVDFIPDAMEGVAKKRGDVYHGHAKFVGPNAIEVRGEVDGPDGAQILEGKDIVVATGSKPMSLPISGAELMITSDEMLTERELPEEVVFVGGGVIALEFGHVYARAGAKVTILEVMDRLLPRLDADAVAKVQEESERIGITVKTGVKVSQITKSNGRLQVLFEHEGAVHTLDADRVVNGAGRVANVDTLDLAAGGISHDGIRIEVDAYLRSTTNPSVWVCGDALVGPAQLSPLATVEGRIVGRNIVDGAKHSPDYANVPSCVHTVPAFASVGLTEQEARASGLEVDVSTNDMTGWFSAKSYAETAAWAKVLVDRAKDRIVGAHMVGHHGEELIHLFALAMSHDIPVSKLKDDQFAFPTFSSDVKNLL